jgi:phosphoribosylformimino-5-aminoimidazole carboxamide ribotide isomerase
MVLIIPTISIVHGVCGGQIASVAHEVHHADGEIYSHDPVDRARLLRKENSKMIHLHFPESDPWSPECRAIIASMREAVDVPFEIGLTELPYSARELEPLMSCGVARVLLPLGTPEAVVFDYSTRFPGKIVPTLNLRFDFASKLAVYKDNKIARVALEISSRDILELGVIDWDRLSAVMQIAFDAKIRVTALHGVRGYPELRKLQDLSPALDSLVLCRALNENRFPCQLIWREVEAQSALSSTPHSNLWSNPLGDKPHV